MYISKSWVVDLRTIICVKGSAKLRLRLIKNPSELCSIQTDSSGKMAQLLRFCPVHRGYGAIYDQAFSLHECKGCAVHQLDRAINHHSGTVGHGHISFHNGHVAALQ